MNENLIAVGATLQRTPPNTKLASVSFITEVAKRPRPNASPTGSPSEKHHIEPRDFTTLYSRLTALEEIIKSKDLIITQLSSEVTKLTEKVASFEKDLNELKDGQHSLESQTQDPTSMANWVTVASRAVAGVEGKKLARPNQQIEVLNSVVSEQNERDRFKF